MSDLERLFALPDGRSIGVRLVAGSNDGWVVILGGHEHPTTSVRRYRDGGTIVVGFDGCVLTSPLFGFGRSPTLKFRDGSIVSLRAILPKLRTARTTSPLESEYRVGYRHPAGTPVTVVETMSEYPTLVLAEVRVPDEGLVGGAWYDHLEVLGSDLDAEGEGSMERNWDRKMPASDEPYRFDAAGHRSETTERSGASAQEPAVKEEVTTMDFGQAIRHLKSGGKVSRKGWNGKNMWLALQVPDAHSKMSLPYIYMSTADGKLVPWLASQTDVLAEDWHEEYVDGIAPTTDRG